MADDPQGAAAPPAAVSLPSPAAGAPSPPAAGMPPSPTVGAPGEPATAVPPVDAAAPPGADAAPTGPPRATLPALLRLMIERGASDLHVSTATPPMLRIDGKLVPVKSAKFTPADSRALVYGILNEAQRQQFESELELDMSFGVRGLARFRANVYMQRGAVAAAFRQIPYAIKSFEELGLPRVLLDVAMRPRGLVLVTGPTGSGKSTTMAALIDLINTQRQGHIITIEDPVEYLHAHKSCLVNQRELGADTKSFRRALKYVLRQNPDVVLIGELRDLEAIESAMTIAETGHLVLATLHTNSCVQTIGRIIDVYPPGQQEQVRQQLAMVLEAVVCQQLLPRIGGGRAMAMEILLPNPAIRNLIREDKVHQVYSTMQSGRGRSGMQTLNHSLADLLARKQIRPEDAHAVTHDADELRSLTASLAARG